jgi:hypothetical protein
MLRVVCFVCAMLAASGKVVMKPPKKGVFQHFREGIGIYRDMISRAVEAQWTAAPDHAGSQQSCPDSELGLPLDGNLYELLLVENIAGEEASDKWKRGLKKAFRRLSLDWHPDKRSSGKSQNLCATQTFAALSRAYEVLSDPTLRDIYDRLGNDGLQRHQDGDPKVKKDWLPDDEILRRHNVPDESTSWNPLDDFVIGVFTWIEGRS